MPSHFKVHELLSREQLDELEAYAREPGRTVDECWTWMTVDHEFNVSRGAVGNWLREFLATDKFKASNETARALLATATNGDAVAINEASMVQFSQMCFEQLLKLQSGGQMTTKDLWAMSMALKNVLMAKRQAEKLKEEVAIALQEAEVEAKAGKSATDVVSVIKKAMGITQ